MTKVNIKPYLYDVIRSPIITEKSTTGIEKSKVTFEVKGDSKKSEIKEAIEVLFSVSVLKVNVINVKGKVKRFRGILGKRSGYKKAVITLAEGQSIDMAAGVQ